MILLLQAPECWDYSVWHNTPPHQLLKAPPLILLHRQLSPNLSFGGNFRTTARLVEIPPYLCRQAYTLGREEDGQTAQVEGKLPHSVRTVQKRVDSP
jgi:hypothetical protein